MEMIFNVISRDGASPVFRTVGAEAQALARAMAEADAKMSASAKAATAEITASFNTLARAHTETAMQFDRANATMIRSEDSVAVAMSKPRSTDDLVGERSFGVRRGSSVRDAVEYPTCSSGFSFSG